MNGNRPPNLIRAIRGPVMLIIVGILFALDHFSDFTLGRTWPAVLIVLGILSLGERFVSRTAEVQQYPQSPTMPGPHGGI